MFSASRTYGVGVDRDATFGGKPKSSSVRAGVREQNGHRSPSERSHGTGAFAASCQNLSTAEIRGRSRRRRLGSTAGMVKFRAG